MNTKEFISKLSEYSNNKIKNIDELELILEAFTISKNEKLFDELIFKAKYLNGLGKIIHSGLSKLQMDEKEKSFVQADSAEKVKNEYKLNLQQFILLLKNFIKHSPTEVNKRFEEKYFKMDQASMVNLTTLIYDLSWIKKFKNSAKK